MKHVSTISKGAVTFAEILQQPDLWLDTASRLRTQPVTDLNLNQTVIIGGAGTSAYAACAVAASWPGALAIPTTDLLLNASSSFPGGEGLLVSLARSGDSPESTGVVRSLQRNAPRVRHIAITCNADGRLAHTPGVEAIVLDPRTNDRGLAMTSSFSNLVLAGLCLRRLPDIEAVLDAIAARVKKSLPALNTLAESIAATSPGRLAVLASPALFGAAREISLKVLEMTSGTVMALPETFLGLRHGPMSFLRPDSIVLCYNSTNAAIRRYEEDVLADLRAKKLGQIIPVDAAAPELPDDLRTPFEIVFGQLLAYHLSLHAGFDPDHPSPAGVITRVVQGVKIYDR